MASRDIIDSLVRARKDKKVNQKQIGQKLDLADDLISRRENGKVEGSLDFWCRYAENLGMNIVLTDGGKLYSIKEV